MQDMTRLHHAHALLARILSGFEAELCEASDEEVLEAAADLRMNPRMQGSAAFAGIKYPADVRAGGMGYVFHPEELAAMQQALAELDFTPEAPSFAECVALLRQLREK